MVKIQEVKDKAIQEISKLRKYYNALRLDDEDFDISINEILELK